VGARAAQRAPVGPEWAALSLSLHVGSSLEGHSLDVGLAFDEKPTSYHLDELLLTCPARPFTTLLNASFEQGADGITPVVAAGTAELEIDVPSPDGARTGRFGAVIQPPPSALAKPSDSKVRLCKLSGVPGTLSVSLWLRALAPVPPAAKLTLDVLDETAGFEWLGSWQGFAPTTAWARHEVLVHVGAARAGHSIDVSLVVGGAGCRIAIDDVIVRAPPVEGAGAPVRALSIDFEETDGTPTRIALVRAADGGRGGAAVGGAGGLRLQTHAAAAALSGSAGVQIDVREPQPGARLVLCRLVPPQRGVLKVVFWARSPEHHPAARLSVDVFDVSDGWAWLGASDEFRPGTSWQRFERSVQLLPAHVGHRLEVGLQVGKAAGVLHVDDIEVWGPRSNEGSPPRVLPPPVPQANATAREYA